MRVLLYNEFYPTKIPEFEKMRTCPKADEFRSVEVKVPTLVSQNEVQDLYWTGNGFNALRQHFVERFVVEIRIYAEQED